MKHIIFTDKNGLIRRVLVRDDDAPTMAEAGLPEGPPDLKNGIDWDELIKQMSNALASTGLWTWDDVQRSQEGVTVATNIVKRALIALYREDHKHRIK